MHIRQRSTCPNCGTREDQWLDEKKKPLAEPLYEPKKHQCHGCRELEIMRADEGDRLTKGVSIVLKRRSPRGR